MTTSVSTLLTESMDCEENNSEVRRMDKYQWLHDNLSCLARLAEFKGQPEVCEALMSMYHELVHDRDRTACPEIVNEFDIIDPNTNVVPFALTARMLVTENVK